MKILLLANYLPDAQQSMQRFARLLQQGLSDAGHQVTTIRPQARVGALKPSVTGFGKWLGYIDKFVLFPWELKRQIQDADVVHICDHSNAFYVSHLANTPHVVTCNDLLGIRSALGEIPENPTGWTGKQLQKMILKGLNRAQRIACISEQTRQDLLRISSRSSDRTTTIYMGLNYPYSPMKPEAARQILEQLGANCDRPFILHVGGNQWYKNRPGVVSIFAHLVRELGRDEFSLFFVGKVLGDKENALIERYDLSDRVQKFINVSNEELRAFYSLATALLFPSLQEGFGWPIVEAQVCGCPVFTSNIAPMTEVGGNAAIYVDPKDSQGAAEIVAASLDSLDEYIPLGLDNAAKFQPASMIQSYVALYEKVIAETV